MAGEFFEEEYERLKTACCAKCKYYTDDGWIKDCDKDIIHIYDDSDFNADKMKCDEWEAK